MQKEQNNKLSKTNDEFENFLKNLNNSNKKLENSEQSCIHFDTR